MMYHHKTLLGFNQEIYLTYARPCHLFKPALLGKLGFYSLNHAQREQALLETNLFCQIPLVFPLPAPSQHYTMRLASLVLLDKS